jgi:ArsR family transcriptional regulator
MHASIRDQTYILRAQVFKVLMHPVRLQILDLLRQNEECVCHMESYLDYRQAYISQQLIVLKSAGLIEENRNGRNIYYKIKNPAIFYLIDAIQNIVRGKITEKQPKNSPSCPCPKCNTKIVNLNHK